MQATGNYQDMVYTLATQAAIAGQGMFQDDTGDASSDDSGDASSTRLQFQFPPLHWFKWSLVNGVAVVN